MSNQTKKVALNELWIDKAEFYGVMLVENSKTP